MAARAAWQRLSAQLDSVPPTPFAAPPPPRTSTMEAAEAVHRNLMRQAAAEAANKKVRLANAAAKIVYDVDEWYVVRNLFVAYGKTYETVGDRVDPISFNAYHEAVVSDVGQIARALGNHAIIYGQGAVRLTDAHTDDCCAICGRLAPWGCMWCDMSESMLKWELGFVQ